MWPETVTPCECQQAGWCERHRTHKIQVWHVLCRTNRAAFDAWEAGGGPRIDGEGQMIVTVQTQRTNCRFRGDEPVEYAACECCGGRIERRPVFSCQHHQKCLESPCRSQAHSAVATCQTCCDYAIRE